MARNEESEHNLLLARKIQQAFLPNEIVKVRGMEIDFYYSPAKWIGGDYYDVLKIDDVRYGFVVVDVTGHGSSAAIVMSVVSFIVHSLISSVSTTSDFMERLNSLLCERLRGETYATGLFMVYNVENSKVEYTNAGHPDILFYSKKNDRVIRHSQRGVMLGFKPDLRFSSETFQMEEGDVILMCTDGLYDAMGDEQNIINEKLVENILFDNKNESARNIKENIMMELKRFIGRSEQRDDITLMIVKKIEKM